MKIQKNEWFYYINVNLEYYVFSIDLGIVQNMSSYTISYKNDKKEKYIFVRIFKLTFVLFSKLWNLLESIIQKINFLNFMVNMENTKKWMILLYQW